MELLGMAVLLVCAWGVRADRHFVFWNSSNSKFLWDDYTVEVRLNDYLDIICPHYEDGSVPSHSVERYTLYLVDYEEYTNCKPRSKDQVRWECNKPFALHGPEKFSEKFQRFTPFTLGKEFKEGHSYYYISKPIHHRGEYCLKLRVSVAGKTTQAPAVNAHTPRARMQSDQPAGDLPGILRSVAGNSAGQRIASFCVLSLLLPLLVLVGC
ncbi:ephrin-A1 [Ambystoma mexicanum]|uniref:ephrin-A1 n=1 Tax=Ambystoma mexicanum TaxID=8296 RepID=UPI0037E70444